jgi:hypothetical protein
MIISEYEPLKVEIFGILLLHVEVKPRCSEVGWFAAKLGHTDVSLISGLLQNLHHVIAHDIRHGTMATIIISSRGT